MDIFKIFYSLASVEKGEGNLVLVIYKNGTNNNYLFYAKNDEEIISRIKEEKKEIDSIYISNNVSYELLKNLSEIASIKIFISSKQNYNLENVFYDNSFEKYYDLASPIRDVEELSRTNEVFKDYYSKKTKNLKSSAKAIKALLKEGILCDNKGKVELSDAGKLFFSNDYKYKRNIILKQTSMLNSLVYTKEMMLDGPLSKLMGDTTREVYELIPEIQDRSQIRSSVHKVIDEKTVLLLIGYILSTNNYSYNKDIEITIDDSKIEVKYVYEKNHINEKLMKYIFDSDFSFETLDNYVESIGNLLEIKTKKFLTTISLYFNLRKMSSGLDPLDYLIIDFAKNNNEFTRSTIDKTFLISPRNSNLRLKKLIENDYIVANGVGKAIRYCWSGKK